MSDFLKYPHLEKRGHAEVDGIEIGTVHVFPKLDGTNASLWVDANRDIQAGSRSRVLSLLDDNAGFRAWAEGESDSALACRWLLSTYPHLQLYGEWLVPHSFKGYRDDAWRRFWIFDVWDNIASAFMPWRWIQDLFVGTRADVILPLAIIDSPSEKQLMSLLHSNSFLCEDGCEPGEGIVLKQYGFRNEFGRTTWAKMVRNEFKERHKRVMGVDEQPGAKTIESRAAEQFVTEVFVAKERVKIEQQLFSRHHCETPVVKWMSFKEFLASRECRKQLIPRLLQTCFYELVREHAWDIVKLDKRPPTVDFNKLHQHVIVRVKAFAEDLF